MNKIGYIIITFLFAVFLNSIFTDFLFRDAIILDKQNNIKAKNKYEACLKTNPYYISAMFNVAYLYIKTEGRSGIKKAFALLKKIEKIDPAYERLHYRIATIYCELGKWNIALKEFNLALNNRKSDPDIYYDMARVYYWGLKDYQKAAVYFKKAVKFGAKYPDIKTYLENIKKFIRYKE